MENLAVATSGLTKRFHQQVAVNAVDLLVPRGAVYGFLGPNGSGKTTTIRMLLGLIRPTAGHHRLLGKAMPDHTGNVLPLVGSLVEGPAFHPYLSARANLVRLDSVDRHADPRTTKVRVDGALDRVGLSRSFRFRFPHQLSGGQRQRVAIARALVLEPDILLLDEPTSSLDASIQAEVLNLLMDVRRDLGTTFLFVSHDLGVIAHMCERVAVMRQGAIVETLPAAQLAAGDVSHPYTRELLANCFPGRQPVAGSAD